MTTMIAEVYEAFISAGADEKKAKAAAEALSSEQLATRSDIIKIERELAVLKWMVGRCIYFVYYNSYKIICWLTILLASKNISIFY